MSKRAKADEKEQPILISYSIDRYQGHWCVVTVKTKGKELVSIEYGEPNPKAIVIESFKILAARNLMGD